MAVGAIALAVLVLGVAIWARTPGGRAFLLEKLVALVGPVNGTLTAATLETDLFSNAVVRDVTLRRPDGAVVAHVDTLALRYRLGGLPGRLLVVPEARVEGLTLTLTETPAGLDIAEMWDDGGPASDEPWAGLPIDLVLSDVRVVDADVGYRSGDVVYGMTDATLTGGVELRGNAVLVRDLALAAPATTPALGPLAVALDGRWDPTTLWVETAAVDLGPNRIALGGGLGRLDGDATVGVGITALHVEPDALAPLTGPLPVTGAFDATGGVAGLLSAPRLMLEVVTPGGPLSASASLDTSGPRPTWSASIAPRDVAFHTFLPDAPNPTVLRGIASAEGAGLTWPDDLDATALISIEAPRLGDERDLAATGTLRLSKGVLDLDDLHAWGPGVRVHGDGVVRLLEETGEARVYDTSLSLPALARFGVPDVRGRATFRGTARFGWGERLGGSAEGTIAGTDLAWAEIGRAASVQGPITATWSPSAGVAGDVVLGVSGLAASGVTAETGRVNADFRYSREGALDVEGTLAVEGVAGEGASGESLSGTLELTRTPAGRLDGAIDLATTGLAWEGWRSDLGEARVTIAGDAATVRLDLRDGARTVVGFDGEVDLATKALRARRVEIAPTEDLAWRADGVQTVRLVEGGVADVRLRLVSDGALLSVEGYGAKGGTVDLRAEARDVRIERLAPLLPGRLDGYAGRVTLRASMEGAAASPALYLDLSADDLAVPDVVHHLDLDVQGVGGDRILRVEGTAATGGERLARVTGVVPFSLAVDAPGFLPDGALDVRLVVPPSSSETWSAVLAREEPLPRFRASAEVTLAGPVRDPAFTAVAVVDTPAGPREEWLRLDLDARTAEGRLNVRALARERLERRLLVDGSFAHHLGEVARSLLGEGPERDLAEPTAWVDDVSLDVVPLRLPVQALAGFVEGLPSSLTGDLSGGLHVGGALRAPTVEGALLLADGHLGDMEVSPAMVSVAAVDGGYRMDANLGVDNRGSVTVGGFVPFAPTLAGDLAAELSRPGLALDVRGDAIPLEAIAAAWPEMEATAGALSVNGTVGGSLASPAPDLTFGLVDGDFSLAFTGVRYRDAAFSGRLLPDSLAVEDLSVRTVRLDWVGNPSEGTITGGVTARRVDDRPVFEGTIRLVNAWIVDVPDRTLRVDGHLRLADRAHKLRVTGKLSVVEGNLVVPERFFAGTSDLALAPDVRVYRRGATRRATTREAAEELRFPTWLDAEVTVALDRNAFLAAKMPMEQVLGQVFSSFSSIEIATQLDGEVRAVVDEGALSLIGEVRPLRGTARVFSRPFELQGETISFTGRDWMDPVLDLVAVHESEYGPITTKITGTPSKLGLAFDAEDPTLAGEDVLSVLVLGRRTSEIAAGEGQGLSGVFSLATSGALGLLNQQVAGGGAFTLDLLEFDLGGLRFGKRIGEDLFVVGEYEWDADPTEENVGEVTLEWQVGRHWQFELTTGTSSFSSLGFTRRWRF